MKKNILTEIKRRFGKTIKFSDADIDSIVNEYCDLFPTYEKESLEDNMNRIYTFIAVKV